MNKRADKIFTNVNGISMDVDQPKFQAIAICEGVILATGSVDEVSTFQDESTEVVDLKGKTMMPGFIDTHQHLEMTARILNNVNLSTCRSFEDIAALITDQAQLIGESEWVVAYCLFDQNLKEKRMPTAEELDHICKDKPIALIHTTLHFLSVNTKAIKELQLNQDMDGVDMDGVKPTGIIRDPASFTHALPYISSQMNDAMLIDGYNLAAKTALKKGITCLHCLEGDENKPELSQLFHNNRASLPLHTVHWNQSMDIKGNKEMGLSRIGGCIFADGAIDCYTAAFFEPNCDQPGNYGSLIYSQETMDDFIIAAHKEGLQIAIHCESDRSIEQVLSAMEKALAQYPRDDHRHRIEHFEVPTYTQIERMAQGGITASMQPGFFPYLMEDQNVFIKMLGPSRYKRLHPYRTIIDAGVMICGGSDSPVTPYDPLTEIQAAVCHPNPDERVTLTEALAMFTTNAAFSVFEENERGCLKPGLQAEFIITDQDPYQIPVTEISKITIETVFTQNRIRSLN